jgi:hypothetical protein
MTRYQTLQGALRNPATSLGQLCDHLARMAVKDVAAPRETASGCLRAVGRHIVDLSQRQAQFLRIAEAIVESQAKIPRLRQFVNPLTLPALDPIRPDALVELEWAPPTAAASQDVHCLEDHCADSAEDYDMSLLDMQSDEEDEQDEQDEQDYEGGERDSVGD